jgi:hypothetical protein
VSRDKPRFVRSPGRRGSAIPEAAAPPASPPRSPSRMDTTMSSWSDLETMVAAAARSGVCWGRGAPVSRGTPGPWRCPPRLPKAPEAGTPLQGPVAPPHAERRAPRPQAAGAGLAVPARKDRLAAWPRPRPRSRRPRTFCRRLGRFSNAPAAAAALRFRLATRPQAQCPGEAGGQRAIETRAVEDRTPLSPRHLPPFDARVPEPWGEDSFFTSQRPLLAGREKAGER